MKLEVTMSSFLARKNEADLFCNTTFLANGLGGIQFSKQLGQASLSRIRWPLVVSQALIGAANLRSSRDTAKICDRNFWRTRSGSDLRSA